MGLLCDIFGHDYKEDNDLFETDEFRKEHNMHKCKRCGEEKAYGIFTGPERRG